MGHVGGQALIPGTQDANDMALWIGQITDEIDDCETSYELNADDVEMDCSEALPGRRLLRRLSHVEYDNTIQDLFGIDLIGELVLRRITCLMDTIMVLMLCL